MKKMISLLLVVLVCFSLASCGAGESPINESESIQQNEQETTANVRTWQDDASNTLVTTMFYWTYERGLGLPESDAIGQTLDNIYDRINYYYQDGFEKNLFFDKFLELYNNNNVASETTQQRDLYSLYVYMFGYLDYDLTKLKDVYSMGYNDDGSNDPNVLGDRRGFIFDFSDEIVTVVVGEASITFSTKPWARDEFSKNFKTILSQQDGIMNGIYLGISALYDFPYKYESVDMISNLSNNEMMKFLTEYMDIYELHRSDIVKDVVDKEDIAESIGKPQVGMDKSQVENGEWGKPKRINKTETQYGTYEQWVYGNGRYVYIENGKVTAVQESY